MGGPDADAVTQLVLREREGRDRGWWSWQLDCFHPGATVNVGWFRGTAEDFVAGSARQAADGGGATHRVSPPTVRVADNRGVVVLPTVIATRTVIDGVEVDLEAASRIVYRVERRDGEWRIAAMDCVYTSDRPDVLGDDQPEQVRDFMDGVFSWAGVPGPEA